MNELTGADFKSATADDNKKLFIETYGCIVTLNDVVSLKLLKSKHIYNF